MMAVGEGGAYIFGPDLLEQFRAWPPIAGLHDYATSNNVENLNEHFSSNTDLWDNPLENSYHRNEGLPENLKQRSIKTKVKQDIDVVQNYYYTCKHFISGATTLRVFQSTTASERRL